MIKLSNTEPGAINFIVNGDDLGMTLYCESLIYAARVHGVSEIEELSWHINRSLTSLKKKPLMDEDVKRVKQIWKKHVARILP